MIPPFLPRLLFFSASFAFCAFHSSNSFYPSGLSFRLCPFHIARLRVCAAHLLAGTVLPCLPFQFFQSLLLIAVQQFPASSSTSASCSEAPDALGPLYQQLQTVPRFGAPHPRQDIISYLSSSKTGSTYCFTKPIRSPAPGAKRPPIATTNFFFVFT